MPSASINPVLTASLLLADAKELLGRVLKPARQRTVISRAYYAAYHACLNAYPDNGDRKNGVGMHRGYLRQLMEGADPKMKAVGRRLGGLYAKRLTADYQLAGIITTQLASEAIEDAEEIVFDLLENEP